MGYEFIIHSLWCLIHPCAAAAAPLVFPQPWTQLYYSLRTCLPSKTGQPFLEPPCLSPGITCSPELGSLWLDEGFSEGWPPLLGGHPWSLLGGQSARSSSFHTMALHLHSVHFWVITQSPGFKTIVYVFNSSLVKIECICPAYLMSPGYPLLSTRSD